MTIRSLFQTTILLLPVISTNALLSVTPRASRHRQGLLPLRSRLGLAVLSASAPAPAAASSSSETGTVATDRKAAASEAIQAALAASKKYGTASPEARVLWDAVEEINASDNSVAYQALSDAECTLEDDTSRACQEYQAKMRELQQLLKEIPPMDKIKSLAEDIAAIKISGAPTSPPAADSPQLRAALEEAKQVSARLGRDSPEARVAWTEVEDIASSGLDNALGDRLDEECLVESAMSACVALEELSRVVNMQRVKDQGMADF